MELRHVAQLDTGKDYLNENAFKTIRFHFDLFLFLMRNPLDKSCNRYARNIKISISLRDIFSFNRRDFSINIVANLLSSSLRREELKQ